MASVTCPEDCSSFLGRSKPPASPSRLCFSSLAHQGDPIMEGRLRRANRRLAENMTFSRTDPFTTPLRSGKSTVLQANRVVVAVVGGGTDWKLLFSRPQVLSAARVNMPSQSHYLYDTTALKSFETAMYKSLNCPNSSGFHTFLTRLQRSFRLTVTAFPSSA